MINCPICSSRTKIKNILKNLPVSSAMLESVPTNTIGDALYRASICEQCGHITNTSPSRFSTDYSDNRYIVKRAVGSAMSANLKSILEFIRPVDGFKGLAILEIGSGSGEIANWLADEGALVDTVDPAITGYEHPSITHTQALFDFNFNTGKQYDLIIARHIIEHTEDPGMFLTMCNTRLKDHGKIYIECPDLSNTLETYRIVDFFNDHIQYFTKNSLRTLASNKGFEEFKTTVWLKGAHMGMMLAKRLTIGSIENQITRAETKFKGVLNDLDQVSSVAIYGAGAHACTFASQLSDDMKTKVQYVFDKSPDKQGKYIPGINVPITAPALTDVELIVNTSSLYINEIEKYLVNDLNYTCPIIHL